MAQELYEGEYIPERFYFSLRPFINMERMKAVGDRVDYLQFKGQTRLTLSAVLDLDMGAYENDWNGIILRMEVLYKPLRVRATGSDPGYRQDEYELEAHTVAPVISILYRVPWRWKLRPYGGVGVASLFSKVSRNALTSHYDERYSNGPLVDNAAFKLDGNTDMLLWSLGLMWGSHLDLNVGYSNVDWISPDELKQQLRNKGIRVSIAYRF